MSNTTQETENAIIEGTMLGIEDHGILTAFVNVKGKGWGQGFGGFSHDHGATKPIGHASLATFVRGVLDALGVETWERLKGVTCRVRWNEGKWNGSISAIGHIVEDKWFEPKVAFAELEQARKVKA